MKTRLFGLVASVVAVAATLGGSARLPSSIAHPSVPRAERSAESPVADQLPQGFTLPSADADLLVSSVVTTDLDADGDLDIVAADRSSGALDIVVWVNDGAGRLTRKAPASTGNLAGEPAAPSLDERQATVMASVQPNGPALVAISANTWLAPPARPYDLARPPLPESVALSTLRSRSPPILS